MNNTSYLDLREFIQFALSVMANNIIDKFVNNDTLEEELKRTSYHVSIIFNYFDITEVIIDQHYKINHPDMNDDLILKLVKGLDGLAIMPVKTKGSFNYYVLEPFFLFKKPYRLIILLEENTFYIGVVNAFRIKEK